MEKSSADQQPGIVGSVAVISLGLVALAGSIAATLCRRVTAPPENDSTAPAVSQLVLDEWEADLARLGLPSRSDLQAMQRQLDELEAQIDQLVQK